MMHQQHLRQGLRLPEEILAALPLYPQNPKFQNQSRLCPRPALETLLTKGKGNMFYLLLKEGLELLAKETHFP